MKGRRWAGVGVLLVLAAGLRLYRLGDLPFEQDELYTLRDAVGLHDFVPGIARVAGKPLYYVLQHGLLHLLPQDELWLRLPAVLFGVLGLWATWALARDRFGRPAALVALALLGVAPWHLYASQFARYWSLVYLLSCLAFLFYFRALESGALRDYLFALAAVLTGVLSHPTFLFPVIGFSVGAQLAAGGRGFGWSWPPREALRGFWIPLILVGAAAGLALLLTGNLGALRNYRGRGLAASLRLLPAVIQLLGPATVTAAGLGIVALFSLERSGDRRWSAAAALGIAGTVVALQAASSVTNVYADYAMGMLPLVFVSIGGAAQRVGEQVRVGRWVLWGTPLVLTASILPSTVSYLSDGSRFDYRPAIRYIESHGPGELVVGDPWVLFARYGEDLEFQPFRADPEALERMLEDRGGYWLVTSYRRYGMQPGGPRVEAWLEERCEWHGSWQRPRLDYRMYLVKLHWCGTGGGATVP